jgi:hypothetical protein
VAECAMCLCMHVALRSATIRHQIHKTLSDQHSCIITLCNTITNMAVAHAERMMRGKRCPGAGRQSVFRRAAGCSCFAW